MSKTNHSARAKGVAKRTHAKIKDQVPDLDFAALLEALGPEIDGDPEGDAMDPAE